MNENHVREGRKKRKKRKLANVITIWLLLVVLLACGATVLISGIIISNRSQTLAETIVSQDVEDVSADIRERVEYNTRMMLIKNLENFLLQTPSADMENPEALSEKLQKQMEGSGYEINIVNKDGIVIASSQPQHVGFDMAGSEQAAEFLVLLDGTTEEYVQDLRENAYDGTVMRYAGKAFPDGSGFIQMGMTKALWKNWLLPQIENNVTNRRIGGSGYCLIFSDDQTIINSLHNEHNGDRLSDTGLSPEDLKAHEGGAFEAKVYETDSCVSAQQGDSFLVVGVYPVAEIKGYANSLLVMTTLLEVLVFGILFVLLLILLRKKVVNNIVRVNDSLHLITAGSLEEKVNVRDTLEFDILSDDINDTVDRLKGYIAEAEARIDQDLQIAKEIQTSLLPSRFPAFPERSEFELFAVMEAAKEVGGDFYDFYMIDASTLGFVIADVSGKSIPGAMFMMRAKTVIKDLVLQGLFPGEVFTKANEKLCEENDAGMFVTAWMGYLNLETGLVRVVNAGHNPPLLIRCGKAEYVRLKPSVIMGTFDFARYKEHAVSLEPGDVLYLYTDGVTEAENTEGEYFGEERLKALLSFGENVSFPAGENGMTGAVCRRVCEGLSEYAKDAEQSDDFTMLCIRYMGRIL